MNKSDLISIRPMVESDRNFVLATILRGLYYGESWFSEIPKHIFMENYSKTIEYLLNKPTTSVNMACLRDDPDTLLGYSITSPEVVHFVFIKVRWRGIGLAKSLVPENTKYATHLTKTGLVIMKNKNLQFHPFML